MPKSSLSSLLLGMSVFLSGCHSFESVCQETICNFRDHHEAKMAWWAARDCYVDCEPHLHHFGLGFIDGYQAVAKGGDGCPPLMPPQKFWGPCYQTCEGREQVVAWYNGYSHGAYAAQSDGVQEQNRVVTARDLYANSCKSAPVVIDLSQFESGETTGAEMAPPPEINLPLESTDNYVPPTSPESYSPPPAPNVPGLLPPAPGTSL